MNFIAKKILAQAVTKTEALNLLGEMRSEAEAKIFKKQDTRNKKQEFEGVMKEDIYKVFSEAQEEIKTVEILTVTVGMEFPAGELHTLGERIKNQLSGEVLVDFKYEPEILGGAKFAWRGQERDYSLKTRLAENSQAVKDNIDHQI